MRVANRGEKGVPATCVPNVRSKALYTLENAPLERKSMSGRVDEPGEGGALSLLLDELVTFQTIIIGHFIHCFAFLPNNLFDFPCDMLRLLSSCGLRLMRLLLFRLGLRLGFCLLAAVWL